MIAIACPSLLASKKEVKAEKASEVVKDQALLSEFMFTHHSCERWWANQLGLSQPQYDFMKANDGAVDRNLKSLWVSMGGKENIAYANCKAMLAKFDEMGIKYNYSEYTGGHSWPVWRNKLYNLLKFFLDDCSRYKKGLQVCLEDLTSG